MIFRVILLPEVDRNKSLTQFRILIAYNIVVVALAQAHSDQGKQQQQKATKKEF